MKTRGAKALQKFQESLEIGQRIREIRELLGLSQADFGRALVLSRDKIANFEDGRTPLLAFQALRLCHDYVISEKWLATGKGVKRQCMDLFDDPIAKNIPSTMKLAEAYNKHLSDRYEELLALTPHGIRFSLNGHENPFIDFQLLSCFLMTWRAWLSGPSNAKLIKLLIETGNKYCAKHSGSNYPPATEAGILEAFERMGLPIGDEKFLLQYKIKSKPMN